MATRSETGDAVKCTKCRKHQCVVVGNSVCMGVALNCKEMGFPTVEFPTNEWEAMASEGDLIDVLGFNGTFSK